MTSRIALVTGTSSGIGAVTARLLLEHDWTVVGIARRPAGIEHPEYRHLALDLGNLPALTSTLEREVGPVLGDRRWQRIGLVNNAASADQLVPAERIDAAAFLQLCAVNAVAPVWLMGLVARHSHRDAVVRIVNVSSAAGTNAYPGLAAYGCTKAGLRMAGMVFAMELASDQHRVPGAGEIAILSYEPGLVDTEMQRLVRTQPAERFPWVSLFQQFKANGTLAPPEAPSGEIAAFLEADRQPGFTERRLGDP